MGICVCVHYYVCERKRECVCVTDYVAAEEWTRFMERPSARVRLAFRLECQEYYKGQLAIRIMAKIKVESNVHSREYSTKVWPAPYSN